MSKGKKKKTGFNGFVANNRTMIAALGGVATAMTLIRILGSEKGKAFVNAMIDELREMRASA